VKALGFAVLMSLLLIRLCDVALSQTVDEEKELQGLGLASYASGDFERAIIYFSQVVERKPKDVGTLSKLGSAFLATNDYAKATETYLKAIEIDSENSLLWHNLGKAAQASGSYSFAEIAYSRAVRLKPDFLRALFELGILYHETKRYDRAIETLNTLVTKKEDHALAHFYLGSCYFNKGDYDRALASFERCIAYSNYGPAYLNVATIHYNRKNYDEALSNLMKAREAGANLAEVYRKMGDCSFKKGWFRQAARSYEMALSEGDHSVYVLNSLGMSYYSAGNPDSAIVSFRKSIDIDSTQAVTHFNLGLALMKKGRYAEAEQEFYRSAGLSNLDFAANIYTQLGVAYYNHGKFPEAIRAYRRSLDVWPYGGLVDYNLAIAYDRWYADKSVALRHYERFIEVAGEDPERRALVETALKRVEELKRSGR